METEKQILSHKMEQLKNNLSRSATQSRELSPVQKMQQLEKRLNLYKDASLLLRMRQKQEELELKEKFEIVHEKYKEEMQKAPSALAKKYGNMIY